MMMDDFQDFLSHFYTKQVQVHIPFILMVGQFLLAKTSKHRLIIPCGLWITLLVIIENTTQLLNILFGVWKNHTTKKNCLQSLYAQICAV